jgi:hypothetical protein
MNNLHELRVEYQKFKRDFYEFHTEFRVPQNSRVNFKQSLCECIFPLSLLSTAK